MNTDKMTAIGLFYAAYLFLAIGVFLTVGLFYDNDTVWAISFIGSVCGFFVLGLLTHAIIVLSSKRDHKS